MQTADVNPDAIRFPRKCPHCGRKAAGTYAIGAMRGLDAFFGGYTVPLLIDVPVCREVFERRRRAAVVSLVVILAIIVASGSAAVVFAFKARWLPTALLGAIAAGLAAGGRTGWDGALLDRSIVGACARSVSSTRVRMSFRRDDYYSEWKSMNRLAPADP